MSSDWIEQVHIHVTGALSHFLYTRLCPFHVPVVNVLEELEALVDFPLSTNE
jgi:hypothetical protein